MKSRTKHNVSTIMLMVLSAIISTTSGQIILIDNNSTGSNNDFPANFQSGIQYPSIQAAIDAAVDGDTIILGQGTFRGDGNRDIDFKGKAITVRSTDPNDPNVVAATIIDCQGSEAESHRGFYFHSGEDENSVVEGLTITHGFHGTGAGIYCGGSSPIIRNNIITENEIEFDMDGGAGIGCWHGASPTITNNIISNNTCAPGGGGGGIRCYEAGSPIIANNTFSGNTASQGAGMCVDFCSPTISDCTFIGNSATGMGGGILIDSNTILTNCSFIGNSARTGAGMYNYDCSPTLLNCCFRENSSEYNGGAIFNSKNSSPILKDCIFTANSSEDAGGAIYNYGYAGDSTPTFVNCTFSENTAFTGGAISNQNSNPTLTNCTFTGNSSDEYGAAMNNFTSSPILTNCTFTANQANDFGGGGICNSSSSPTLANCLFNANISLEKGGAIMSNMSSLRLINCNFVGNTSGGGGNALAFFAYLPDDSSNLRANNCIFRDGGNEIWKNDETTISITYSNVESGWPGEGNIDEDPLFADPNNGDYHLKSQAGRYNPNSSSWVKDDVTSPCIDSGDPMSPIGREPFPNGGIINMGAYGGTLEASKSYFGEPVCETKMAGDINGDCRVDFLDFKLMALNWLQDYSYCQFPEFCGSWSLLWKHEAEQFPSAVMVQVDQTGGLGEDLENRVWLMVSTQYHRIYFQQSTDQSKIAELYYLIDNIYEFLQERSSAKPEPLIKAFIVPGQLGHSRCSMVTPAMRTGDQGDIIFIVTSLLHEETHLFNFAFLEGKAQGWWTGEFTCIYFQTRAELQARGKNVKDEIAAKSPNGPLYHLRQVGGAGQAAFDEAFAVLFFLEQNYGSEAMNSFRMACLESSKATNGGELPETVFFDVFGKNMESLEKEWLEFYSWKSIIVFPPISDPRLMNKVSFSAERASVQSIVQNIAEQAGLGYNWGKSYSQTEPVCRKFIWNVQIDNKPLYEALEDILDPQGLTYRVEQGEIVLYKVEL